MIYIYKSIIGDLLVESCENVLNKICLAKEEDVKKWGYKPVIDTFSKFLDDYFDGKNPKINFEINVCGTPFQKKVWQQTYKIPYGETTSYKKIGDTLHTSYRAVGGALNKNPILIVIPCHRVIGENGNLVGFAGGLDIKKKLLNLEGINVD